MTKRIISRTLMNSNEKLNQKTYSTKGLHQHIRRILLVATDGSNNADNTLLFNRKCDYEAFYVDNR